MAENVLFFFVASVCELKKMAITEETPGSEQEKEDVSEERPGNYLRARRNLQTKHKNANHNKNISQTYRQSQSQPQTQTLSTGQNSYNQIPKPPQTARTPKNYHARTAEGIFILFYFISFFNLSFSHNTPHFFSHWHDSCFSVCQWQIVLV